MIITSAVGATTTEAVVAPVAAAALAAAATATAAEAAAFQSDPHGMATEASTAVKPPPDA